MRSKIVGCFLLVSMVGSILAGVSSAQIEVGKTDAPALSIVDLAEAQRWSELLQRLDGAPADIGIKQPDGMTAIHWAALHDQSEVIDRLVKQGADVNAMNEYEVSPLSLACEFGSGQAVSVLLRHGAEVKALRLGNETPLMFAARGGAGEMVDDLVGNGADVNAKDAAGQTALMWAAAAGNDSALKSLMAAKAELDYRLPKSDFSAVMFAARNGHEDCVVRLLDAGLDINAVMKPKRKGGRDPRRGTSALLLAIESGHLELAMKLIEKGADPDDRRSGFAPLHAISWIRRTELGDNPYGDPAPRITGNLTTLEFAKAVLDAGADVNQRVKGVGKRGDRLNQNGATPFLLASRGADIEFMKLLLRRGADPKILNDEQTSALMVAAGVGVIAVGEEPGSEEEVNIAIQMLVDLGLDPNRVDNKGATAMHGAALRNYPSTVTKLASVGADPAIWNRKNKRGQTPHDIAGGKRPGSVKPSPPTIAALDEALQKEE